VDHSSDTQISAPCAPWWLDLKHMTRWLIDPVRSTLHFEAPSGNVDLDYAISEGYLDMTVGAPATNKLMAVLKLAPPIVQPPMRTVGGLWAEVLIPRADIEISMAITQFDPSTHRAECEVVFNGAHSPLTLTTSPRLVDLRRGILVLTASGDLKGSALGLRQLSRAGSTASLSEVGRLTIRLSAWTK
jgi:hypothetical protein